MIGRDFQLTNKQSFKCSFLELVETNISWLLSDGEQYVITRLKTAFVADMYA